MKLQLQTGLALAIVLATPVAALAAAAPDKAEKVAAKMLSFEKALLEAGAKIDATLGSMNALAKSTGPDMTKAYKTFSGDVADLEKMAQKTKSQAEAATSQREEYLKKWQETQGTIQNEQLKAAAEARRTELEPKIEAIRSSLTSAKETFTPFLQDLKDLTAFLGNDLSSAGITAASDLMQKSTEAGTKVKGDVDRGAAAVRDLAASIQPGGVVK